MSDSDNKMKASKLKELITNLVDDAKCDPIISVSDGYNGVIYEGNFSVTLYKERDRVYIDIGVGGCEVGEDFS